MTDDTSINDIGGIIKTLDMSFILDKKYCDSCLGRLFAKVGKGLPNEIRGQAVRDIIEKKVTKTMECQLCNGIIGNFDYYVDLAVKKLEEWESSSFLIGSKFDAEIV